ncbi:MAG: AAA family ATPase, partial [Desulfococcaceae bacterium]
MEKKPFQGPRVPGATSCTCRLFSRPRRDSTNATRRPGFRMARNFRKHQGVPDMLAHVKLTNVGPAPKMEMEFGKRLNVLTGDNGLGKSFLLDIVWWCLTRKWPAQLNPRLPSGLMAKPHQNGPASIEFSVLTTTSEPTTKSKGRVRTVRYSANYDRKAQAWTGKSGRPLPAGLVVFAQVDGGFAVWDPARNYWRQKGKSDVQDRPPAYVFSPREVWDGLAAPDGSWLCNGLIRDWAGWQKENGP